MTTEALSFASVVGDREEPGFDFSGAVSESLDFSDAVRENGTAPLRSREKSELMDRLSDWKERAQKGLEAWLADPNVRKAGARLRGVVLGILSATPIGAAQRFGRVAAPAAEATRAKTENALGEIKQKVSELSQDQNVKNWLGTIGFSGGFAVAGVGLGAGMTAVEAGIGIDLQTIETHKLIIGGAMGILGTAAYVGGTIIKERVENDTHPRAARIARALAVAGAATVFMGVGVMGETAGEHILRHTQLFGVDWDRVLPGGDHAAATAPISEASTETATPEPSATHTATPTPTSTPETAPTPTPEETPGAVVSPPADADASATDTTTDSTGSSEGAGETGGGGADTDVGIVEPADVAIAPASPLETATASLPESLSVSSLSEAQRLGASHWSLAAEWGKPLADAANLTDGARTFLTDAIKDVTQDQGGIRDVSTVTYNAHAIGTYLQSAIERLSGIDLSQTPVKMTSDDIKKLQDIATKLLGK